MYPDQVLMKHRVGRARVSDWLENSFIMHVYEKIFSQNFLFKARIKKILIDNNYRTISLVSQKCVLFLHGVKTIIHTWQNFVFVQKVTLSDVGGNNGCHPSRSSRWLKNWLYFIFNFCYFSILQNLTQDQIAEVIKVYEPANTTNRTATLMAMSDMLADMMILCPLQEFTWVGSQNAWSPITFSLITVIKSL